MILIRDTFQLRFGRIDQAVELFRRLPQMTASGETPQHYNALTDISGPMYTFVWERTAQNLAAYEPTRSSFFEQPGFPEWFKEFQLIVETGRREFYSIEWEYAPWSQPGHVVVRETYRALKWQIRPAVGILQRYGAMLNMFNVGRNPRVLTDQSGEFFQAIVEIETEGLSEWEASRRKLYREPDFQAWFAQLSSCVERGAHEFFRVEI